MFSPKRLDSHALCCTGHPRHKYLSLSVSDRPSSRNTFPGGRASGIACRHADSIDAITGFAENVFRAECALRSPSFGTAGLFVFNKNTFAEFR